MFIHTIFHVISFQFSSALFIHSVHFIHLPIQLHPLHSISFRVMSCEKHNNGKSIVFLQFPTTLFMPTCNLRVVTGPHLEIGQLQGALFEPQRKQALLNHLSRLGLCWHRTPPEIGQLQGALSEQLCLEAFLHCLSCLGFC